MGTNGDELVGMVRDGKVELASPAPWPDGASVRVLLVEAQPNTPEAIAAWVAANESRPGLDVTEEEWEEMQAIWREMRGKPAVVPKPAEAAP